MGQTPVLLAAALLLSAPLSHSPVCRLSLSHISVVGLGSATPQPLKSQKTLAHRVNKNQAPVSHPRRETRAVQAGWLQCYFCCANRASALVREGKVGEVRDGGMPPPLADLGSSHRPCHSSASQKWRVHVSIVTTTGMLSPPQNVSL